MDGRKTGVNYPDDVDRRPGTGIRNPGSGIVFLEALPCFESYFAIGPED
jgi:hypothetical protein